MAHGIPRRNWWRCMRLPAAECSKCQTQMPIQWWPGCAVDCHEIHQDTHRSLQTNRKCCQCHNFVQLKSQKCKKIILVSYNNPVRNLSAANSQKLVVNVDKTEHVIDISSVGFIMRFRPFVSARNPHKCDDAIMPRNPAAVMIPLSCVEYFMSHWLTGNAKLIPQVSEREARKMRINKRESLID